MFVTKNHCRYVCFDSKRIINVNVSISMDRDLWHPGFAPPPFMRSANAVANGQGEIVRIEDVCISFSGICYEIVVQLEACEDKCGFSVYKGVDHIRAFDFNSIYANQYEFIKEYSQAIHEGLVKHLRIRPRTNIVPYKAIECNGEDYKCVICLSEVTDDKAYKCNYCTSGCICIECASECIGVQVKARLKECPLCRRSDKARY